MNEDRKLTLFEEKILPILSYVGAIGAGIMSIAYIILVVVLINGFKAEQVLHFRCDIRCILVCDNVLCKAR